MILIDGKTASQKIYNELRVAVETINGRKPSLTVIIVGSDPASKTYVRTKQRKCGEIGMISEIIELPEDTSEHSLLETVSKLNDDNTVDGIIVQVPLPKHINTSKVSLAISADKDVDGFNPINLGKLLTEEDGLVPCTPLGITVLIKQYGIDTAGKDIVIVGRSTIVGKPMAALLMQKAPHGNATVTVAHSRTKDLAAVCRRADIIISAIGKPHFITAEMVKDGAVVIDVGINRIDDTSRPKGYRVVGDVDFDNVKNKCSHITPVPGGVGLMTVAMLLSNTLQSFNKRTR